MGPHGSAVRIEDAQIAPETEEHDQSPSGSDENLKQDSDLSSIQTHGSDGPETDENDSSKALDLTSSNSDDQADGEIQAGKMQEGDGDGEDQAEGSDDTNVSPSQSDEGGEEGSAPMPAPSEDQLPPVVRLDDEQLEHVVEQAAEATVEKVRKEDLPRLGADVFAKVSVAAEERLSTKFANLDDELRKSVKQAVKQGIETLEPKVIKVEHSDGTEIELDGEIMHNRLNDVLDLITCEPAENVMLVGPSGSGKTHLVTQLGKVTDRRVGMISCSGSLSEADVLGRAIPNLMTGEVEYQQSEFVDFFENGGIWLFDESDAADSNMLLVMNAATSNATLPVRNRPEQPYAERHPDFICICAANTFGSGADRVYVGRNQMDGAFLDRFRLGTVEMDYDKRVEQLVCPDEALCEYLWGWRQRIEEHKLRRMMTTRFMKSAYKLKTQKGWSHEKIADQFFNGWTKDEIAKVRYGKG